MSELNVSLPPALRAWIESRIAEGRYSSAGDYVRDIIRQDQNAAQNETEWLRSLVYEGLDSKIIDEDPKKVLREIMTEHPSHNG